MKKILLLSLAMMCIFGVAHAQESKLNEAPKDGAKIVFTTLEHHYGTIMKGGDGTCSFEFVNEGNEPLILNTVAAFSAELEYTVIVFTNAPTRLVSYLTLIAPF